MKIKTLVASALFISLLAGLLAAGKIASSKIVSNVEHALPGASGVSASIPFNEIPGDLTSNSIKSADIKIERYVLKASKTETSLQIKASNISKSRPTLVGSLDVTATISASTILKSSGFNDAKIVGDALQVSVGSGGLGQALLIPKYSNNQLFFELKSVSLFGNEIPSSSLPSDIQQQIKSKSARSLNIPQGLTVKLVSLNSDGLLLKMQGSNIQLGSLGKVF